MKHLFLELRVLWLTLALLGGAEVALHPWLTRPRTSSLATLETWSTSETATDVMLIGSSRFRVVQPETVAAGAGRPLRVVNASFNGGTWDAAARLLDRYAPAERLASGPRLVVIGSGVMDANDGYQNAMIAANLWRPTDLFAHVWESGTDAHTRAYLFAVPPASSSALLTAYQKKLLRGELRDAALRVMASLGGSRAAVAPTAAEAEGDGAAETAAETATEKDVLDNADATKAAKGVTLTDIPPPVGGIYSRNFHLGGRQAEALRDLVRRLKAAGATPVLVDAPLSDWYRRGFLHGEEQAYATFLRDFGQAEDVAVFLLPREAWGLSEDDYFVVEGRFDGHHIASAAGRERFGASLGRLVVGPLWEKLDAGGSVGFADGRVEALSVAERRP